jgi:hypothetical protein
VPILTRIAQRDRLHAVQAQIPEPQLATLIQALGGLWLRLEHRHRS